MSPAARSIGIEELAEAVSEGVLRAVAANAQFKTFLGKDGPGLVLRPFITAGGIIFLGASGRYASIGSNELEGIGRG